MQVRYRIADSLDGRFRIDEETGVILTRGSFDNLDGQRLSLTVSTSAPAPNKTHFLPPQVFASDNPGGSPSLTSTAIVNLVVLNDFQRISVLFSCGIGTIFKSEEEIIG